MQTIGVPYANYVYSLCKEMMYERCARTWYTIFTVENLILHIHENASSQMCAYKNCKSKDDRHQVSKQRKADVLQINYRYFGNKTQRVLFK